MLTVFDNSKYLAIITSQFRNDPKYMAFIAMLVQPFVDRQNLVASFPEKFDLDLAEGQQLDWVGLWVGQERGLPIAGEELLVLNDTDYLQLLKATIAANYFQGTIASAKAVWDIAFGPNQIAIQDNQDMTILFLWLGATLTTIQRAMIHNGYFSLKPAGVKVLGYFETSVPDTPVFGFDVNNSTIAGWDTGAWAIEI